MNGHKVTHAFIVKPDNTFERIEEWNLNLDNLLKMQEIVGGYIEYVAVWYNGHPCTMVVNEEGMLHNLPVNTRATAIYWTATAMGKTGVKHDPLAMPMIYGTVILLEVSKYDLP